MLRSGPFAELERVYSSFFPSCDNASSNPDGPTIFLLSPRLSTTRPVAFRYATATGGLKFVIGSRTPFLSLSLSWFLSSASALSAGSIWFFFRNSGNLSGALCPHPCSAPICACSTITLKVYCVSLIPSEHGSRTSFTDSNAPVAVSFAVQPLRALHAQPQAPEGLVAVRNHQDRIVFRLLWPDHGWLRLRRLCGWLGRRFLRRVLRGCLLPRPKKGETEESAQAKANELRAQEIRKSSPRSLQNYR